VKNLVAVVFPTLQKRDLHALSCDCKRLDRHLARMKKTKLGVKLFLFLLLAPKKQFLGKRHPTVSLSTVTNWRTAPKRKEIEILNPTK
jgi:hypothetical protein